MFCFRLISFTHVADAANVEWISHDISCCRTKDDAFNVSATQFHDWIDEALETGMHVFMRKTWADRPDESKPNRVISDSADTLELNLKK